MSGKRAEIGPRTSRFVMRAGVSIPVQLHMYMPAYTVRVQLNGY